jgi:ABC-type Fe3+-siderophore transport system permease subunit
MRRKSLGGLGGAINLLLLLGGILVSISDVGVRQVIEELTPPCMYMLAILVLPFILADMSNKGK